MCCVLFDFNVASKNFKEKDIERQPSLEIEIVDYISPVTLMFNEIEIDQGNDCLKSFESVAL